MRRRLRVRHVSRLRCGRMAGARRASRSRWKRTCSISPSTYARIRACRARSGSSRNWTDWWCTRRPDKAELGGTDSHARINLRHGNGLGGALARRTEKWTRFSVATDAPARGMEHRINPNRGSHFAYALASLDHKGASMFKTILVPVDLAEIETPQPAIDAAVCPRRRFRRDDPPGLCALPRADDLHGIRTAGLHRGAGEGGRGGHRQGGGRNSAPGGAGRPPRSGSARSTTRCSRRPRTSASDLIVVGSHRPSMATYLLGSNASTIVRHARSSVLVVRR